MPTYTPKQILTIINFEIQKHQITNFKFVEVPEHSKTVINIFDKYPDVIPDFLIELIADIIQPDAIALEKPFEDQGKIPVATPSKGSHHVRSKRVISPIQSVQTLGLQDYPLVFIGVPAAVANTHERPKDEKEWKLWEDLCSQFMAAIAVHFIPGEVILMSNRATSESSLYAHLDLVENLKKIPLYYKIDSNKPEATVDIEYQNGRHIFSIITPTIESLRDPKFEQLLHQALTCDHFWQLDVPSRLEALSAEQPEYPFTKPDSKNAVFPSCLMPDIYLFEHSFFKRGKFIPHPQDEMSDAVPIIDPDNVTMDSASSSGPNTQSVFQMDVQDFDPNSLYNPD